MTRVRQGDTHAYARLVERYQSSAIRLATLVTRDPTEAEDVAQNAFIKAYYALDSFKPDSSFRAWLLRIVVNEARNSRSAARRRTTVQTRFGAEVVDDAARSAEDSAVANEQRVALLVALDDLRDDDRAVLAYRYLFAMSEAEMAQALGCQLGTVKSRLSRALRRLRERLDRTAPLIVIPVDIGPWLSHGLPNAVGGLEPLGRPEFAPVVLQHIAAGTAAGAGAAAGAAKPSIQHVTGALAGAGAAIAAIAAVGLVLSAQHAPVPQPTPVPQTPVASSGSPPAPGVVVYGGDLSDAQHAEVQQLFGDAASGLPTETVARPELIGTLQSLGLPLDGSERATSSVLVACQAAGSGVHVHTQNITEVPAAAYANALVTAGVADASVLVAGPPSSPMTGETALVGILRAVPDCRGGQAVDAAHLQLAYDQLHVTSELAASNSNWDRAAAAVLRATESVVTSPASDAASIGAELDGSVAAEGISEPAGWHDEAVSMLTKMASVDHGPYRRGYDLREVDPTDVWVRPNQQ
ncbi:MAG: DUF1002 domain-containing protein [Chloroflexi bacterium]|nr:DUF1002 domain-containing protein [Chloroflexota bacterium]MBV9598509.1 DUF1002 domain-containing protein [Chloroflexota bacterium]